MDVVAVNKCCSVDFAVRRRMSAGKQCSHRRERLGPCTLDFQGLNPLKLLLGHTTVHEILWGSRLRR